MTRVCNYRRRRPHDALTSSLRDKVMPTRHPLRPDPEIESVTHFVAASDPNVTVRRIFRSDSFEGAMKYIEISLPRIRFLERGDPA